MTILIGRHNGLITMRSTETDAESAVTVTEWESFLRRARLGHFDNIAPAIRAERKAVSR